MDKIEIHEVQVTTFLVKIIEFIQMKIDVGI